MVEGRQAQQQAARQQASQQWHSIKGASPACRLPREGCRSPQMSRGQGRSGRLSRRGRLRGRRAEGREASAQALSRRSVDHPACCLTWSLPAEQLLPPSLTGELPQRVRVEAEVGAGVRAVEVEVGGGALRAVIHDDGCGRGSAVGEWGALGQQSVAVGGGLPGQPAVPLPLPHL